MKLWQVLLVWIAMGVAILAVFLAITVLVFEVVG